jgi:hypothetical protein
VLLLAARHTSAEIAARLRLAVATVNNNLARAYSKLGITSRHQLRQLLNTPHTPLAVHSADTPIHDSRRAESQGEAASVLAAIDPRS